MTADAPGTRQGALRTALLAVIAVGLLVLGGGLAVLLGVGRGDAAEPGTVDVGFSRDMARHHLQGVEMANLVPDRSEDPAVQGLAFDITSTQNNQVGRMHGWLDLWDHSPTGGEVMAWMSSDEHAGHTTTQGALMPGMATEDELAELRSLEGGAFDVRFLQLMLRHHEGGLDMAEYGAEHAEVPAVRELARAIALSQTGESDLMTSMLEERGAEPLPSS